jgi:hypothetical protein
MISKSEWSDFRKQELYQELLKDIISKVEVTGVEIITREDQNPDRDQFLKGFIAGLAAVVDWHPELEPDEVEADDADEV